MTELIINRDFGACEDEGGNTISVLLWDGLYNLQIQERGGFPYWAVENKKRLSTLQKYLDNRGYKVTIKER